jgi:hypothetical protein
MRQTIITIAPERVERALGIKQSDTNGDHAAKRTLTNVFITADIEIRAHGEISRSTLRTLGRRIGDILVEQTGIETLAVSMKLERNIEPFLIDAIDRRSRQIAIDSKILMLESKGVLISFAKERIIELLKVDGVW